jgi:hypothetical protein
MEKENNNIEHHLPFHNYAGPGTKVITRILRGDIPVNYLDATALIHDVEYIRDSSRKHADQHFRDNLNKNGWPVTKALTSLLFSIDPVNRTEDNLELYNIIKPYAQRLLDEGHYVNVQFDTDI